MELFIPAHERRRLAWIALAAFLLAIAVGAVLLVDGITERRAVDAERERLLGMARLASSSYQRQVDKFQLVATTLSADPDVGNLLDRRTVEAEGRLNRRLADLTAALDASVIYLIDDQGLTIAASNWRQADSFLGENYGFRAYYKEAMLRGRWEQFALGTRSRVPGLFVARRVETPSGKRGVIVVKIRFDRLEAEWAASPGPAFVASEQGVILVTSKPAWRFQTIGRIDDAERRRLTAQFEYGNAPLRQNPLFADGAVARDGAEYTRNTRFVAVTETLPNGWTINLLAPISDAMTGARSFGRLVLAIVFAAIAGLVAAYIWRARTIVARQRRETELRIAELKERLVQANKLSTLGQIAAGVGHEINQPLTAIGIRAQTARKLIGKGRLSEAEAALDEIGALTGRAGAITGELRRFSRRADRRIDTVLLAEVFAGVQLLLGDRIRTSGVHLSIKDANVKVMGEQGRLEQVFVNLIQNALDAIGEDGEITITVLPSAKVATIRIHDSGAGIPISVRDRLFQPFNSTKDDGLGLGLVICRDIVAEMGGELHYVPSGEGTTFSLTLKAAA